MKRRLMGLLFVCCLLAVNIAHGQVVINEVMVQPSSEDQLFDCGATTAGREYVELFNSSKCDTVVLDCYVLGGFTSGTNNGSFIFPPGTKLAPLDFIVVGGPNTSNVDFNLGGYCGGSQICGSTVWSLPNDYGWVGLYNTSGAVEDAVFWTAAPGQPGQLGANPNFSGNPCFPGAGCNSPGSLKSAATMTPGTEILYAGQAPNTGFVIHRSTDGGSYQTNGNPTPGTCNGVCLPASDLVLNIDSVSNETCQLTNGYISVFATGGIGPYEYDWSNNTRDTVQDNLDEGTYSATVTDADGCQFDIQQTIVNVGDTFTLVVNPDAITLFEGEQVSLQPSTMATVQSYLWSPSTGLNCLNCASPVAKPRATTTYTLITTDINGCMDTASAVISVLKDENSIFVPTGFTPDQPTNNILYVRSPRITDLEFRVYDRWGEEVFLSTSQAVGWDGRNKRGQKVSAGVYVYFVNAVFDNGKTRTVQGNVTLLR